MRRNNDHARRRVVQNPQSQWVTHSDESLRIVPDEFWHHSKSWSKSLKNSPPTEASIQSAKFSVHVVVQKCALIEPCSDVDVGGTSTVAHTHESFEREALIFKVLNPADLVIVEGVAEHLEFGCEYRKIDQD
jgi:hypothetical protein